MRHGLTSREQVVRAVESLRVVDAHVIGNVLNMAPAKGPDAYGYGYAYRYTSTPNRVTSRSTTTLVRSTPSGSAGNTVVPTGGRRRRGDAVATPVAAAPAAPLPSQPPPSETGNAIPAQSTLDAFFTGAGTGQG